MNLDVYDVNLVTYYVNLVVYDESRCVCKSSCVLCDDMMNLDVYVNLVVYYVNLVLLYDDMMNLVVYYANLVVCCGNLVRSYHYKVSRRSSQVFMCATPGGKIAARLTFLSSRGRMRAKITRPQHIYKDIYKTSTHL